MSKIVDLTGKTFGRLTVLNLVCVRNRRSVWRCLYECGKESEILGCTEQLRNKQIYKNNKSGVKGVCWNKKRNSWNTLIGVMGKQINIGFFGDIEEATEARIQAEIKYWNKIPS